MRRWAALLGLLCGLSLLAAPAAAAATLGTGAHAYPVTTCSTLSLSTQHVRPGQAITVTGSAFEPKVTVHLVLRPEPAGAAGSGAAASDSDLGTATTDATGSFTTKVTVPGTATDDGAYQIIATTGATAGGNCPADPSQTLDLAASGANGGVAAGSNSGSGTAFTGLDVAALLAVALGLVGTGVVLTRRGRRVASRP